MMETIDIKKFQNRTKDSIRLLAFFEPKKGRGQELEKILLELAKPTRKEQGNISYVRHRSTESPVILQNVLGGTPQTTLH
jgi:hypothetical protein